MIGTECLDRQHFTTQQDPTLPIDIYRPLCSANPAE
jgi:hypothetical protein